VDLPELAPSDQALLHRFRASESPAAEVVRRVQARLAARIAQDDLAPLAPVLPLVELGKAAAIAVALAAAVLIVLGGSARIVQAVRTPAVVEQASDVAVPPAAAGQTTDNSSTPAPAVRDDRSRVVVPEPVAPAIAPAVAPAIDLAAVPGSIATPKREPASRVATAPVADTAPADAAAEIALLKTARRERDPETRLRHVQEHARRFPNGALLEEIAVIEIESLCALGRRDRAAEVGAAFLRRHPESAYAAIARRGCAREGGR